MSEWEAKVALDLISKEVEAEARAKPFEDRLKARLADVRAYVREHHPHLT